MSVPSDKVRVVINNQSIIPSTDVIQLTLTLKMTTAQVVETSVIVNNSPIPDYVHPDDQTQPFVFYRQSFKSIVASTMVNSALLCFFKNRNLQHNKLSKLEKGVFHGMDKLRWL